MRRGKRELGKIMDKGMEVRDTESWKSYNLVDSVVDLSTVEAPAQKTLGGLRRLRGDKFAPLGWA